MTQELRHLDELAELPEKIATDIHFDRRNESILYFFVRLFAAVALILLIRALTGPDFHWGIPVLSLALAGLTIWRQRTPTLDQRFVPYGFAYLVAQLLLFRLAYWNDVVDGGPIHPIDFMLIWVASVFRLTRPQLLLLLGIFWLPITYEVLLGPRPADGESQLDVLIGFTFFVGLVYGVARLITWRRKRAFSQAWQRASEVAVERRRLRGELEQARRIQLSMLPQVDPALPWLELAGSSQPATEVGGDYYDYFALAPERQGVVVADVAGHGMASGLILAAVRGCLVLLHDEERSPAEIFTRLEKVVRTLGGRRTFVAMLYAVFDRAAGKVRWAAAGMPPVLHYRAQDGELFELLEESLPLGPTLPRQIAERELALAPGDVVLFASDGMAETPDADGNLYGDARLHEALRRLAPGRSAADLRDHLLAELATFRGDADTTDDVTLVVARLR